MRQLKGLKNEVLKALLGLKHLRIGNNAAYLWYIVIVQKLINALWTIKRAVFSAPDHK